MASVSLDRPVRRSYCGRSGRRRAGSPIGRPCWFFRVVVLAVEATAGAVILEGWVPAVPQWARVRARGKRPGVTEKPTDKAATG